MTTLPMRTRAPSVVDVREHRFQLGVVGIAVLLLGAARRPKLVMALAMATAFPVLPMVFRRLMAPQLGPATRVEDARLPAFARLAGGVGLAGAAGAAWLFPSIATRTALLGTGAVCCYGAATGYCVPCNVLLTLERMRLIELDPPLVCAVPA